MGAAYLPGPAGFQESKVLTRITRIKGTDYTESEGAIVVPALALHNYPFLALRAAGFLFV